MKRFSWRGNFLNNQVFAYVLGCDNMDYMLKNACTRNSSVVKRALGKLMVIHGNWQYALTTHNEAALNHKYGEFTDTRNYKKHTSKDKKKNK